MNPLKIAIQTALIPALTYKNGSIVALAIPLSFLMDLFLNSSFLGISVSFGVLFIALIIIDLFTGIIASRHVNNEPIKSAKLALTFYKALMYALFFWILWEIKKIVSVQDNWMYIQGEHFVTFIRNFVFIILVLREYISIGENIEKRFGSKPYIFTLAEKLFDIIERKIIKKIEDSDFCDNNEKRN
jgi:hypothetical protein